MLSKKSKSTIAAFVAAVMGVQMIGASSLASAKVGIDDPAKNTRDTTVDNAYGDKTYSDRFMSLYDDVVTRGVANGYMSSENKVSGGLGIPYHAVEEVICEAPDYGHETTSEAMSYLVWVAAMHDNIVKNYNKDGAYGSDTDLAEAWKTLEVMVPSYQPGFNKISKAGGLKATYSDEWQDISKYPSDMDQGVTGINPLQQEFQSAYSSTRGDDDGIYLMNWLADVDNWYGFGDKETNAVRKGTTSFTFINTFQRGDQESCWETVPFSCVETKKYGNSRGLKGIFSTESSIANQYAYTNAPDAEDRAIQAVYAANRWGVGDTTVSTDAGMMGDYTRNDMYDKYYKKIGAQNKYGQSGSTSDKTTGKHYLMAWYTSWGGATDGSWAWQIGASHIHEFYQNPLAAYALTHDTAIKNGMKSTGANEDFDKSLVTQIEFYEWLQSADGMFAGGCTNSYNGRYEAYPSGNPTFTVTASGTDAKMTYVEHPVYSDPGSNHWIGNQVWATQRLAELYYYLVKDNDDFTLSDGSSAKEALGKMLNKWVQWFDDNTILGTTASTKQLSYTYDGVDTTNTIPDISSGITDDGKSFSIPASLIWTGAPDSWTGSASSNSNLHCQIVGYGNGDIGCVGSLANTLIYYAKAMGVDSATAYDKSVYRNSSASAAEQGLYIAKQLIDRAWNAGRDEIGLSIPDHNGSLVRFWTQDVYIPASYGTGTMPNGDVLANGKCTFESIRSNYEKLNQAHAGHAANPAYDELKAYYDANNNTDDFELNYHRFWHEGDFLMALGTMTELYNDVTPGDKEEETTTETTTATESTTEGERLWGDSDVNGVVDIADAVLAAKNINGITKMTPQGIKNADCYKNDGSLDTYDIVAIIDLCIGKYTQLDMPIQD